MAAHIREKTVAVRECFVGPTKPADVAYALLQHLVRHLVRPMLTQHAVPLQIVGGLLFIAFGVHALFDKD